MTARQVMVRPSFVLGGRAMEIVYRCGCARALRKDCLAIVLPSAIWHMLFAIGMKAAWAEARLPLLDWRGELAPPMFLVA